MSRSPRSRVVLAQQERRAEVARLKRAGVSNRRIAETVGVSKRTVLRDLDHVLDGLHESQSVDGEAWQKDLLDELVAIRSRLWQELDGTPSPAAVAAIAQSLVRVVERTAVLLGVDAPSLHLVGHVGQGSPLDAMTDDEARDVLAKTAALGDWAALEASP